MNTHKTGKTPRAVPLRLAIVCLAAIALAACTNRRQTPAPMFPPSAPATGLRVMLTWDSTADLDLYLTGPSWETVYFGNNPSSEGGKLERDVRCADLSKAGEPPLESATFAEPAVGHYRVGIDYMEACNGQSDPQPYRLLVEYGGVRHEQAGVARHHEFVPIVLEFELRQMSNGPLTLVVDSKPGVNP